MFSREGELISADPSIVLKLVKPSVIVPLVSLKSVIFGCSDIFYQDDCLSNRQLYTL